VYVVPYLTALLGGRCAGSSRRLRAYLVARVAELGEELLALGESNRA
jgi:hypothetical protein